MKEQQVTFASQNLKLEGLYAPLPAGARPRAAAVCHPHPLYGGSMYNNVVDAVLQALWEQKFATLRFNFRGVGASEGRHGGGEGEAQDAVAAMSYLQSRPGLQSAGMVLAGYSFGAAAAWRAASQVPGLDTLILIALPLQMIDVDSAPPVQNILMIAGQQDSFCAPARIKELHSRLGKNGSCRVIAGADHFFVGQEDELTTALKETMIAHDV